MRVHYSKDKKIRLDHLGMKTNILPASQPEVILH